MSERSAEAAGRWPPVVTMKRKAFQEDAEDDAAGEPPRLDDCFLAEEILPRLPAHAAHAFSGAGAIFRAVLTDPAFWLPPRARAPPTPTPRTACLVVRKTGDAASGGAALLHEIHYADAAFSAEPAVAGAAGASLTTYGYAGTCNGLVLLAVPWSNHSCATGVLFNPASGEEAAVTAVVPDMPGGGRRAFHRFCGFGYSPSSKAYKALLLCVWEWDFDCVIELMVVPLGGGAAARRQQPRRVAAIPCRFDGGANGDPSSLSQDGNVYVLPDTSSACEMLAFNVDDDTVTFVKLPPTGWPMSELMEVWGRPCVATAACLRGGTMLWTFTPENLWELRCSFAAAVPSRARGFAGGAGGGDMVHGAWDCGDGRLFVMFRDGRGCMYEYGDGPQETAVAVAREVDDDDGAAAARDVLPVELRKATFCWGYLPTLIPPATVLGDGAACPDDDKRGDGLRHFSSGRSMAHKSAIVVRERGGCLLELLMERMRKRPLRSGA